jgi:hypothetical protein
MCRHQGAIWHDRACKLDVLRLHRQVNARREGDALVITMACTSGIDITAIATSSALVLNSTVIALSYSRRDDDDDGDDDDSL